MTDTARAAAETTAANASGYKHEALIVEGMHCASCAGRIERVLLRRPGVHAVEVNYATRHAALAVDSGMFDVHEAAAALDKLGYRDRTPSHATPRLKPTPSTSARSATGSHACTSTCRWRRCVVVLVYGFSDQAWARWLALTLTLPVQFVAGWPILTSGLQRARHLSANMDTLIALGTLTAFAYSTVHLVIGGDLFYDTTVVIMAFIVLGRYFEARATGRASGAIRALLEARSQAGPRRGGRAGAARSGRGRDRGGDRSGASGREDPRRRRGARGSLCGWTSRC